MYIFTAYRLYNKSKLFLNSEMNFCKTRIKRFLQVLYRIKRKRMLFNTNIEEIIVISAIFIPFVLGNFVFNENNDYAPGLLLSLAKLTYL